jgi:hypothetical protein
MKKTMMLVFSAIFLLSFSAAPALAGSKQRHRWQGVAIGLGAAILGSALINNCETPERVVAYAPPRQYHPGPSHFRPQGHWETRRVWVPPEYERVWNPGHYECGRWVSGQWIDLEVNPGYWREERVRVSDARRDYR